MAHFPPDLEFLGIDNGGVDLSTLEYIISTDGGNAQTFNFGDLNGHPQGGKFLNVAVETKVNTGHSLPESPPDSEHPYSPQDGCEAPLTAENVYSSIYKEEIFNPIGNFLSPSNVVLDQNSQGLVDENGLLQDDRLNSLPNCRMLQEGLGTSDHDNILTDNVPDNQQILLQNVQGEHSGSNGFGRSIYQPNEFVAEGKHVVNFTIAPQALESIEPMENSLEGTGLSRVYTNVQNTFKKRKLSQDSPLVKNEPVNVEHCTTAQMSPSEPFGSQTDDDYGAASESCLSESPYQCIRFNPFQQSNWHVLCDQNLTELATPQYKVDADKGFNFSNADDAFVCQKKNHFQITCHVQLLGDAQFVRTPDGLKKIVSFHLHFYGVKHDCPSQTIRVEQSQSDRSKKPFHPVLVDLVNQQVAKVTVGRLHFSETTSNNMRKKGKPNPEQRYFQLVVGLHAHTINGNFPVISHASQKIIVRASNPGQFESDVELCWQKGQNPDTVFHNGKVGINTDRPDESLVVHGNIRLNGHLVHPSDVRAKKNIVELNTAEQLKNVQKLRVVRYDYEPTMASQLCGEKHFTDTGMIAQEVAKIIPEAVKPAGDLILQDGTTIHKFLVVNKDRIYMENIGAVKELCKVMGELETRIDQVERNTTRMLNNPRRADSLRSDSTVNSSRRSHSIAHCKCSKRHRCKYCQRQDEEMCSNKLIHVVIVFLFFIMAFCLAAITTLYMMETAKQKNGVLHSSMDFPGKIHVTKKPSTVPKSTTWTTHAPSSTTGFYIRTKDINKIPQAPIPKPQHSRIIGSPNECQAVDQNLEGAVCQIYCCAPSYNEAESDLQSHVDKRPINENTTRKMSLKEPQNDPVTLDKTKDPSPLYSNSIDKLVRTSRDTYDNNNDATDDELTDRQITITVQGDNFNTSLSEIYLGSEYNIFNTTYFIPISKYMPDTVVKIIFRFNQTPEKKIQNCPNELKQDECYASSSYSEEARRAREIQTTPSSYDRGLSVTFLVIMTDFQSKVMTYRASLNGDQEGQENLCNIPDSGLGEEFIVYNFHFQRNCKD